MKVLQSSEIKGFQPQDVVVATCQPDPFACLDENKVLLKKASYHNNRYRKLKKTRVLGVFGGFLPDIPVATQARTQHPIFLLQ
jgi:hypothetical protein